MTDAMNELTELAEGNPGAMTALVDLLKHPLGTDAILKLKEQDITGPLIWVGYSDHCDKDTTEFISGLLREDDELMDEIETYRERLREMDESK